MPWYTIGLCNNIIIEELPDLNLNNSGYLVTTQNGKLFFSSEEMDRWKECSLPSDCQAYQIFNMNNGKLLLLSRAGDVYYSDTGENWVLALSTGVVISDEVVPDRHFALFDSYCYLCVDDATLYRTTDGINWETISLTRYYYGKCIRTVGDYLYKFNGKPYYNAQVSYSSDTTSWKSCGTSISTVFYIHDVGILGDRVYLAASNSAATNNIVYNRLAASTSSSSSSSYGINSNLAISRILYSNTSNSIIVSLNSTPYIWYYLDPTNATKFIKVENNSEITNSSGYFYDEQNDRYIAQFSNCWCYIDASNVSSECVILDNANFPESDTVVYSFVHKSANNDTT